MKLNRITQINGQIILLSGLHIGAGGTEMHIGGTDNSVVSHPHTRLPYIPGSSLKGKVRALLEMRSGCMDKTKGKPLRFNHLSGLVGAQKEEARKICSLFGVGGADGEDAQKIGPTRVSFADCSLSTEWVEKSKIVSLTEIKAETAINRVSGTAEGGSLRMTERVVGGVAFDFSISIKEMEGDQESFLTDLLLEGLKMLELDALGGSGSRGYGRVTFTFTEKDLQSKFDAITFS